jgi:DNA-binding MarR family transcriptional regulator
MDNQTTLNVGTFTQVVEDFNSVFIRLPAVEHLNFTTLSVLHTLSRKGPLRIGELLNTEQLTQPAITQVVQRLEHGGLVKRQTDPRDGRAVLVHLTERGVEVVASRHAHRVAQLTRLVAHLTPTEQEVLALALPVLRHLIILGGDSQV